MSMGQSGGRSAKNPTTGRRRLSPDERAQRVHMKDDPMQWPDPPKAVRRWAWLVLGIAIFTCLSIAALIVEAVTS